MAIHIPEFFWHTRIKDILEKLFTKDFYKEFYSYGNDPGKKKLNDIFDKVPEAQLKEFITYIKGINPEKKKKSNPWNVLIGFPSTPQNLPCIIIIEEGVTPIERVIGDELEEEEINYGTKTESFSGTISTATLTFEPLHQTVVVTDVDDTLHELGQNFTISNKTLTFTIPVIDPVIEYEYYISKGGEHYGDLNGYTVRIIIETENHLATIFITALIYAYLKLIRDDLEIDGIQNLTMSREQISIIDDLESTPIRGFRRHIVLDYMAEESVFKGEDFVNILNIILEDPDKDVLFESETHL